eukprot:snap_masked-scaffold_111-processed-gene-0.5-mRNA-1 protein AED:1.00 eAED:1.00 QI:0/-1/0/0/-1/1/1/0/116
MRLEIDDEEPKMQVEDDRAVAQTKNRVNKVISPKFEENRDNSDAKGIQEQKPGVDAEIEEETYKSKKMPRAHKSKYWSYMKKIKETKMKSVKYSPRIQKMNGLWQFSGKMRDNLHL